MSWFPYIAVLMGVTLLAWESQPYWDEPLGKIVLSTVVLTGLVVFRQIITVRENVCLLSEQTRRQSEVRFSSLVENSSDLITILDSEGEILYESPSVINVLGYEVAELTGKQSFELIHPEDIPIRKQIFETLLAQPDSIIRKELRFKHKDGAWHVLETVSRVYRDEVNNLNGILVNSRDITQRKHDEEKFVNTQITPGLILLDLNMPRKSGLEALREIKDDQKLRRLPVVILTTSKAEEDIIRSYDLGVNSFIVKPVTFEALVELIKEIDKYWFQIVELPKFAE